MDNNWKKKGVLSRFNQHMYLETKIWERNGLDEWGYVYYPYTCVGKDKHCKVHVALHGCGGQVDGIFGWDFIVRYGYTQYAASNDLVIIFPQVK